MVPAVDPPDNAANGIVTVDQQAPSDDDEAQDDEMVPIRDADAPLHTLKPSVRRGIRTLAKIWSEVAPVHIFNCWRKSDILPEAWRNLYDVPAVALPQREYEELAALIPVVHPEPVGQMNALEYVHALSAKMSGRRSSPRTSAHLHLYIKNLTDVLSRGMTKPLQIQ